MPHLSNLMRRLDVERFVISKHPAVDLMRDRDQGTEEGCRGWRRWTDQTKIRYAGSTSTALSGLVTTLNLLVTPSQQFGMSAIIFFR